MNELIILSFFLIFNHFYWKRKTKTLKQKEIKIKNENGILVNLSNGTLDRLRKMEIEYHKLYNQFLEVSTYGKSNTPYTHMKYDDESNEYNEILDKIQDKGLDSLSETELSKINDKLDDECKFISEDINKILDKINTLGIESLSKEDIEKINKIKK